MSSTHDFTNERIGNLIVLRCIGQNRWVCQCDCGAVLIREVRTLLTARRRGTNIACMQCRRLRKEERYSGGRLVTCPCCGNVHLRPQGPRGGVGSKYCSNRCKESGSGQSARVCKARLADKQDCVRYQRCLEEAAMRQAPVVGCAQCAQYERVEQCVTAYTRSGLSMWDE